VNLSRFIIEHMELILAEWDAFARTLDPAASGMTAKALRNHARQILEMVAQDIDTEQSAQQEIEKSKGHAKDETGSAASKHGRIRHQDGFTMVQMVAEYRALRASVLRLWLPHVERVTERTTSDMLRFNEAIDQAVAESTARYVEQTARTRDTFLAVLGHDLRTPLAAMAMAGDYLTMPNVGTRQTAVVGDRVKRSAAVMSSMVSDLLEYARSQLDNRFPIVRQDADMHEVIKAAISEVELAYPRCPFELRTSGRLVASFDDARLRQAIVNLLTNAVQYRSPDHPVVVSASEMRDAISVQVQNQGPVIPKDSLQAIFNPLVQLAVNGEQNGRPSTSLGLGLFIARRITEAHAGTIMAESDERSGTVFTIRLPKTPTPTPESS
jgi:signal transduction histidine kinase